MNMIRAEGKPIEEPKFVIEEVTDPVEIARSKAQSDQFRRNTHWIESHWGDVLPQARGKFLAVAGQEAFLADSPRDAYDLAKAAHPEDNGVFLQYIRTDTGPRIYAHQR